MRKFAAVVLFLALLLSSASALTVSDLDVMIYGHNLNRSICGAQELTGQPEIDEEKGSATFFIPPGIHCIFFFKDGKVTGFSCACTDPSQESEFLAQSVTACYNFAGTQAGETCYDAILSQFMFARGGNELGSTAQVPGLLLKITKMKTGYAFVMVKVK